MPPQLREIGFHVENYATQWHPFQHEIKNREIVVAWIQLTLKKKRYPDGSKSNQLELGYNLFILNSMP